MEAKKHPSSKRYPPEMRERAVHMVEQSVEETGDWGVVARVTRQLGIGEQTLRNWVERAEVDAGKRLGVTAEEKNRIAEWEKEVRELHRANAILRSAEPGCLFVSQGVSSLGQGAPTFEALRPQVAHSRTSHTRTNFSAVLTH